MWSNSSPQPVHGDAHHQHRQEEVEQHAELDERRDLAHRRDAEAEDAVLEHQVAEALGERLAPGHDQEDAREDREEGRRHDQARQVGPVQRHPATEGHGRAQHRDPEQHRGREPDLRVALLDDARLAGRAPEQERETAARARAARRSRAAARVRRAGPGARASPSRRAPRPGRRRRPITRAKRATARSATSDRISSSIRWSRAVSMESAHHQDEGQGGERRSPRSAGAARARGARAPCPTPRCRRRARPAKMPARAGSVASQGHGRPNGASRPTTRALHSQRRRLAAYCMRARSGPPWSSTITSWIMVSSRCVVGSSNGTRPVSHSSTTASAAATSSTSGASGEAAPRIGASES